MTAHPEIGRPFPEMSAEHREWPTKFGESAYIVLYRYDGETVTILAIRHAKEAGY